MIPVKNPKELEKMRLACQISAAALRIGGEAVKEGVSTWEIDRIVHSYITSRGARPSFKGYGGFPASACISINDVVIHGIPSKQQKLKDGDIVSLDIGAYIDGFHGDNASTFSVGSLSEDASKLLKTTQQALYKGIEAAWAGARIGDVSHAVQSYVEEKGFSVVRAFVGHGVGKELHEAPEVPNFGRAGHGPRLVPGMTIAIEPMINAGSFDVYILDDEWTVKTKDGSLSAHFEHTIAITKNEPEILTRE